MRAGYWPWPRPTAPRILPPAHPDRPVRRGGRVSPSVKEEGDAIELGTVRTETFWNSKTYKGSTPTVHEISRIDVGRVGPAVLHGPLPPQGVREEPRLIWPQVKWSKDERDNPVDVHYECAYCRGRIEDHERYRMVRRGRWEATRPWVKGIAGFHISSIYSPWTTLPKLAIGSSTPSGPRARSSCGFS